MREEKRRRRGNEAVWPYIRSRLIQTKKRKHPKWVIMQMVQMANGKLINMGIALLLIRCGRPLTGKT